MTVRAASLAITIFVLVWSPEICFIEELASKIITTSLSFGEAVAANADLKLKKNIWQKHIAQCLAVITYMYRGRRGRDRMVVGFTTTYAISAYHHWSCEFESRSGRGVQHYVIKFVSDLRQVGGFLWVLRFPPIKRTTTI
jgi:hypothetical protein